jgi:hypothetical protein
MTLSGSFGYLGSQRQTASAIRPRPTTLGGSIRLPVLSRLTETTTLGDVAHLLPSSGGVTADVGKSGVSPSTQAAALGAQSQVAITSGTWVWLAVGAVVVLVLILVSR